MLEEIPLGASSQAVDLPEAGEEVQKFIIDRTPGTHRPLASGRIGPVPGSTSVSLPLLNSGSASPQRGKQDPTTGAR